MPYYKVELIIPKPHSTYHVFAKNEDEALELAYFNYDQELMSAEPDKKKITKITEAEYEKL